LKQYEEALNSYDKAIELEPIDHYIWHNRGGVLTMLGRHDEAIASYDKALEYKPDYHYAWQDRGVALRSLKREEESLASYDKALEIQPNEATTWSHRGHALKKLKRYEEAMMSYGKALEIQPDDENIRNSYEKVRLALLKQGYQAANTSHEQSLGVDVDGYISWRQRGDSLKTQGKYEEALASYNKALEINPDAYETWVNRGDLLVELGKYEQAVDSYDKALEINPDDYEVLFSQGIALSHLGNHQYAINSFDSALKLNPDYAQAWNGRGNALKYMGCYEEAITSYDHAIECITRHQLNHYWRPWKNRGWAILRVWGYNAALSNWDKGLRYLQQNQAFHQEGCGVLHYSKGKAHYSYGRQQQNPLPYWREAKKSYQKSLEFLPFEQFPDQYLEVLQDLIGVCRNLGEIKLSQELLRTGTDLLHRLLQETSSEYKKIQIAQRFAGFNQLRVDELAQSPQPEKQVIALELAEERKNICLNWLRNGWSDVAPISPKYTDIQELLDSNTAAIYWHISPAAITTFVLKHNQPPIILAAKVNSANFAYPADIHQLQDFEDWIKEWKRDYQRYRNQEEKIISNPQSRADASWRREMPERLEKLAEILNIPSILFHLLDVDKLLLFPHRDLHLLPLHALFPAEFTIIYLPCAQIGLDLKMLSSETSQKLLTVENPSSNLNFAALESALISLFYPDCERLKIQKATKKQIIEALKKNPGYFHFTGHGYHDMAQPRKSALELANKELLTLGDIFKLDFQNCNLVCLSACETGLTSEKDLIDEYVGLVSGFLAMGTSYVVSTLWTVQSEASALLMIEFYRQWHTVKSEVVALARAVQWLRNLTVQELSNWYEIFLSQLPSNEATISPFLETELDKLSEMEPKKKLYEHPYYWAAYIITGKPC
jgi:CHAT domain-containing protein/tetratricopeptide (TPR) repeat protein